MAKARDRTTAGTTMDVRGPFDPESNELLVWEIEKPAFFKIVVASTVFSGHLFQRLLFLLPLGVECHRSDRRPVACGT